MSDSNSQQQTSQQDNRNVLGQGALQAQGGSTVIQADNRQNYQTDNSTSISYALDGDVANTAMTTTANAAVRNLDASLTFGTGALDRAFSFGGSALADVMTGEKRALDMVANSNSMVKDAYADAKGRGAMTDKITMGALAMAGIVALMALKGKA